MAKLMFNGISYDTKKAERVFDYISGEMKITLYRTRFGMWYYVYKKDNAKDVRPLEPENVRQILFNRDRSDLVKKYDL